MIALALAGLLSCQPAPDAAQVVTATAMGVEISDPDGVERVTVLDAEGVPLVTRRLPEPLAALSLQVSWPESGEYTVEVVSDGVVQVTRVAVDARAMVVAVEAPVGQDRLPVSEGEVVAVTLVDGRSVSAAVTVTALKAGEASVEVDEVLVASGELRAGERLVATAAIDGAASVTARLGSETLRFALDARALSLAEARQRLTVSEVVFPADASGRLDVGRPPGRVTLSSAWWQAVVKRVGLGARARDPIIPWGWYGVTLQNNGDAPVNVALQLEVLDEAGRPAAAFRPRLRDGDDRSGVVRALLRVPAGGRAVGALPLYVDERLLTSHAAAEGRWTSRLSIYPLGSDQPAAVHESPLYVSRGSAAASAGLGLAVLASTAGCLMLAIAGRRWLGTARTSDLTTVALFGALSFLVSAAGRLLGAGVAAALGPFSTLLTALVDDALRYALLATLLTLLPRPGTATLMALTGWLLTGMTTGGVGPAELLYITGRVAILEAALWLAGITRETGWRDAGPWARWLRLSLGFGSASLLTGVTGIAVSMVMYRLFYADWYVAMLLIGPGFLYVVAACGLAVGFADSLRRVQR